MRGRTGRSRNGDEPCCQAPPAANPDPTSPALAAEAVRAAEGVLQDAIRAVRARVAKDGQPMDRALDREQRATHALAWLATYVEAVRQLAAYAERMREAGRLGELEQLIVGSASANTSPRSRAAFR